MPVRNLQRIFEPQNVAVIGASDHAPKVGYTVLHNLTSSGFAGPVFPVNHRQESVQGLKAYRSVTEIHQPVDLAIICTPAETVAGLVRQCGEAGVGGVIIITAGFRETGSTGKRLEEEVRGELARFDGLRVVGPNCLGILVPRLGLNASFAGPLPAAGRLAFVSQSGALCTSVLDWARAEGIGFSAFVSIGNMLDVSMGSLIDYFAADRHTSALVLYIESITGAREFMSAARAFTRIKPIVAYKAGRFAESAQAAASHTGAMAGVDAVYDAALARAGIVRLFDMEELFDCAELLARQRPITGGRLCIVTNAGGPGVMATDALIAREGELARLSEATVRQLNQILPPYWSHANPIDLLGDAPPERFARAIPIALADPGVDALLVILTPQAMTDATATANAVAACAAAASKPLLACWMGGEAVHEGVQILSRSGTATYETPERAVQAFLHLVDYGRRQQILYETPREIPISLSLDRRGDRNGLLGNVPLDENTLSEDASKSMLEAYGIATSRPLFARTSEQAVALARQIGYPVVLKIHSPQITHKTDVGGVALDLSDDKAVRAAYDRMIAAVSVARPDARIEGVTVQPMLAAAAGTELILGAKKDPVFGPVVMVGAGGIAAELLQDRALELPPLNERLALRMLQSLRSWPLLSGYRGRPAVHLQQLIEVLMRFSYLIADLPELAEVDINPLLVSPESAVALDARMVIDRQALGGSTTAYSHLAIRPYPNELIQTRRLKDGMEVVLRPIKPEDEPLWHEMLENCSQRSIWFRFRYLFRHASHEVAARYCFIDYDREMAMVAELTEGNKRHLIGVGRLVADPDHRTAEFAVLVGDAWQGKGLGNILLQTCLNIATEWHIQRVVGETTVDNLQMLTLFRKNGFRLEPDLAECIVLAKKDLPQGEDAPMHRSRY